MSRVPFIAILILITQPHATAVAGCSTGDWVRAFRSILAEGSGGARVDASAASHWGRSGKVKAWNAQFPHIQYPRGKLIRVSDQAGSAAAAQPELAAILSDVGDHIISPEQFQAGMKALRPQEPTIDEWKAFYNNRLDLYKDGVQAFAMQLSLKEPGLAAKITESIELQVASMRHHAFLQPGLEDAHLIQRLDKLSHAMQAHLVELRVAASVPHVRGVGVHLENAFRIDRALKSALERHLKALQKDPKYVSRLQAEYPRIMTNRMIQKILEGGQHLRDDELIEKAAEWIGTKEIDVLREVGGRLKWVEIKSNNKLFTIGDFIGVPGRSPQEQMLEDLEIVRFLGPEAKVDLEFYTTGPISLHAHESLKRLGVGYSGPRENLRH